MGNFLVTVTTDYGRSIEEYDANGNLAYGNNTNTVNFTSTLAPSPNLEVEQLVVNNGSSSQVLPGASIPVSWTDINTGGSTASGTWVDQVFLAGDAGGATDLQLLQTVSGSGSLTAPTGTLAQSTTITVPTTDAGNKWVVVTTGLESSFFELDTANNTAVSAAPITIPPSLQVSLAAPGSSTFYKNAVNPATSATVTRNDTDVGSLAVTVTSSNPAAVLLAASPNGTPAASIQVTIPDGSFSAVFYVDAVQDGVVDGTQTSTITAAGPSNSNYVSLSAVATELESNTPALTLTLGASTFPDTGGTTATLSRNTNPSNPNDTALTVDITSSDPTVATAPAQVTIPANQNSVTFPIGGVSTNLLVDTRDVLFATNAPTDPVTGLQFAAVGATATVTDPNIPVLELATDAPAVEENASNPATFATLSLTNGSGTLVSANAPITVNLFSNDASDLVLPSSVTVPQGTSSVSIPLTAIDNPNNANPVVTVTAYATDAITHALIVTGHATATITVLSTNGPSLAVTTTASFVAGSGSATGTVSRANANTTQALTVNLTSSNVNEATVSAQVVIQAGQTSAPFTITGANGGAGPVTIEASSTGLNTGVLTLEVVNSPLPDLAVTAITPPANAETNQTSAPLTWQVTNDGNVAAAGTWVDHVVVSTDQAGNNVLFSQNVPFTGGSLAAGSSYIGSTTFTVPATLGVYYVSVTTNTGANPIQVITGSNDVLVVPMTVGPDYTSTLQAGTHDVIAGASIPLSGLATEVNSGGPAPFKAVFVSVLRNGDPDTELGPIFTNVNGAWSTTYTPPSNQPGHYQFIALTDGMTTNNNPAATDAVDFVGMEITPNPITVNLVPGTPAGGTVFLSNLSGATLTNLVVSSVNEGAGTQQLPITVSLTINNPATLAGFGGITTADYTLTATQPLAVTGTILVTCNSDQGTPAVLEFDVTITPAAPKLFATALTDSVVIGTDSLASVTLTNIGSATTGPLTISSPVSWITPASDPQPLAAGQSEQVEMQLDPALNQTLGLFTGSLTIGFGNTGVAVPISVIVVSNQQSTLQVTVDDDLTANAETHPHVADATVELIDPLTSLPVVTAITDQTGIVTLSGFVAGTYQLEVTAAEHGTYSSPVIVARAQQH